MGLDLSPAMVKQARQLNPEIRFQIGDMMKLDFPDQTLAGIVACYSIVNSPQSSLPTVSGSCGEFCDPEVVC